MEIQLEKRQPNVMGLPILKGALVISWGIMAIVLFPTTPFFLMKSFGVMNLIAGVITLIFTLKHPDLRVSKQWMILETFIELFAGIMFTFIVQTVDTFIQYMTYGILFIVILQFIYGYALMNKGQFNMVNMLLRFLTLIVGVVVGLAIYSESVSLNSALLIIGVFSIIYGVLNVQYGFQMKNAFLGKIK